jgi:hypothetical protein
LGEKAEGKDNQGDLDIGRRILHQKTECGGINWINLAQDGDQYKAHVSTEMNLWVLQRLGNP